MKRHRRQFSADWKAKVALEAIKGQRTIQEIASHYEIHPNLVTHGKKELLERAVEVFSSGKTQEAQADEELKAELYQQIGKLQVEVDWLKKSRDFRVSGATGMDRSGSRGSQHRRAMRADGDFASRALLHTGYGKRPSSESSLLGAPEAEFFSRKATALKNPSSEGKTEWISQTPGFSTNGCGEGIQTPSLPLRPHPCFDSGVEKDEFSFTNSGQRSTLERPNFCLNNGEHLSGHSLRLRSQLDNSPKRSARPPRSRGQITSDRQEVDLPTNNARTSCNFPA